MTEGWKTDKLGNILELKYGRNLPKSIRSNGSVPVFGSNGIVGYHNEALVKQKGIIVGRKGSAGIVNFSQVPFYPIDTTFYLTQEDTQLDLEFLYYALQKLDLKRILGDVAVPGLNREMAYLEELNYPKSVIEQRNIASILTTIKQAVNQQAKLICTTNELKKNIMHKLLAEGLNNEKQKNTEIGLIPTNWDVKQLINVVDFIDYGVSQAIPKTPPKNGVKIVSTADINREGELLYDQIRTIAVPQRTLEKLKLRDGDLLFNWRNSAELIGKSTIFHEQSEPHIFASFILRISCGEIKSHNYFLKHLMNHYREEGIFIKLSRRAVNQANYNRNEISVLKIPVPPIQEQVEIAKIIGTVEKKINHHKTKMQVINNLFKTLLNDLMTGKRRVNEINFQNINREYEIVEQSLSLAAEE